MEDDRYDLVVIQGATLSRSITWTDPVGVPVNLTGGRVEFQWRTPIGAPVVDFDSSALTAGLTLDVPLGASGVIAFSVSKDITAQLSFPKAVWDLFVTLPTRRKRLLFGSVLLVRAVTRD